VAVIRYTLRCLKKWTGRHCFNFLLAAALIFLACSWSLALAADGAWFGASADVFCRVSCGGVRMDAMTVFPLGFWTCTNPLPNRVYCSARRLADLSRLMPSSRSAVGEISGVGGLEEAGPGETLGVCKGGRDVRPACPGIADVSRFSNRSRSSKIEAQVLRELGNDCGSRTVHTRPLPNNRRKQSSLQTATGLLVEK
jgi:hypothetical protein